jgi:hypothetical protein
MSEKAMSAGFFQRDNSLLIASICFARPRPRW